ncbi:putative protein 203L [Cricket iridovirus]|nr:putative protein 203L [Cricket iridovirus]
MSIQTLIIISIVIFILWLTFTSKSNYDSYHIFMKKKNHIFHNINKWAKKDVSKLLETLLKPFDKQCVKKTRTIESLEKLRTKNNVEFKKLLNCGYIHNLFILIGLSVWEDFSKLHTETSLNTFINECLIPISTSPNFLAGNMLYTQTKPGVLKCLNDKNL